MIPNEPRAPYALEPNAFPFPALAALAGRAPLGGQREAALACFVVSRLVAGTASAIAGSEGGRERLLGVKHWLGSAAIGAPLKQALTKAAEAAFEGDRTGLKSALEAVMTITANQLDPAARLELARFSQAVVK